MSSSELFNNKRKKEKEKSKLKRRKREYSTATLSSSDLKFNRTKRLRNKIDLITLKKAELWDRSLKLRKESLRRSSKRSFSILKKTLLKTNIKLS